MLRLITILLITAIVSAACATDEVQASDFKAFERLVNTYLELPVVPEFADEHLKVSLMNTVYVAVGMEKLTKDEGMLLFGKIMSSDQIIPLDNEDPQPEPAPEPSPESNDEDAEPETENEDEIQPDREEDNRDEDTDEVEDIENVEDTEEFDYFKAMTEAFSALPIMPEFCAQDLRMAVMGVILVSAENSIITMSQAEKLVADILEGPTDQNPEPSSDPEPSPNPEPLPEPEPVPEPESDEENDPETEDENDPVQPEDEDTQVSPAYPMYKQHLENIMKLMPELSETQQKAIITSIVVTLDNAVTSGILTEAEAEELKAMLIGEKNINTANLYSIMKMYKY